MEEKNNLDDFLKDNMSLDNLQVNEPGLDLVSEARKKIMARKIAEKKNSSFWSFAGQLLNFRIKLYQGGLATMLVAGITFYMVGNECDNSSKSSNERVAEADTLNCSSAKANMFLLRNFSSHIN